MTRTEVFDKAAPVEDEDDTELLKTFNTWGRRAMFFCIWAAMAIPVLLVIYARLSG
ncbi:hypothetical protein KUV65_15450 [Maritalea mobilis]|uniref:hypothetical protein n=1 Tax=Maritalea mobilis TaxID=483324 RepID=UPI001C950834|nr:hypothetical protein [Maritalea mobilis]MBY6202770.1 hypothetical protein [Maritalea mobilis]